MPSSHAHSGPSSPRTSESSSDDIEMTSMQEIAITPKYKDDRHQGEFGHVPHAPHSDESDDESDRDEETGRGLLTGTRTEKFEGEGRSAEKLTVWQQVRRLVIETCPTLLLTTIGLIFTGELLDHVSHWEAMLKVNELIVIIPVVLNLKGNLEMNLSARLGTAANVGELDHPSSRRSLIRGNLALLQVQAALVSFIAANIAFALGKAMPAKSTEPQQDPFPGWDDNSTDPSNSTSLFFLFDTRGPTLRPPAPMAPPSGLPEYVMVVASAMCAAALSSALLGSFMCGLVVVCRYFGLDPDNIAPPIASCLGDLVTLTLLGVVSSLLINFIRGPIPFLAALFVVFVALACLIVTRRNKHVKPLVGQGWSPLIGAMIISTGTGIVLDLFVSRYKGFALLAVVISGLPGSVGSIFISRLSTALHAAASLPGVASSPHGSPTIHPAPLDRPRKHTPSARLVGITLLLVTFPIELIFLFTVRALGWLHLPFGFLALSLVFFCFTVGVSLSVARGLTAVLWSWNFDPDMYAMPIHSALMDLVGQLLLVLCFEIVSRFTSSVKIKPPSS